MNLYGLVVEAALGTTRSSLIAIVLLTMGAPISLILASQFNVRVSAALALLCGLLGTTVVSWYAFRFGLSVKIAYVILLALGVAVSTFVAAKALRRNSAKALMQTYAPSLFMAGAAFVIPVFVYSLLSYARIETGALPLLTAGNNDIFAYLKLGDVLRNLPDVTTAVGSWDVKGVISIDAFGAFNLVSLSSFTLNTSVEQIAIPLLGMAVGVFGLSIATICKRIFNLPLWISIAISVVFTTTPVIAYVVLNYFLAQVLFTGVLLVTLLHVAEMASERESLMNAGLAAAALSALVMFTYHPWFVQYMMLSSAAIGGALVLRNSSYTVKAFAVATAYALCVFVASNLFSVMMSVDRYIMSTKYLIAAASTVDAGWPLPFINLALFLGLPVNWSQIPANGQVEINYILPGILILATCMAFYWRSDKEEGRNGRRFLAISFIAAVVLYLAIWELYGESYRQWKFAATLTMPLGFIVTACGLFAFLRSQLRFRQNG